MVTGRIGFRKPHDFADLARAGRDGVKRVIVGRHLRHHGFPIANVKEISPWGDGSRRERIRCFQRGLAEWAKERHGTWARAAKALGCDERTLREDAGQ